MKAETKTPRLADFRAIRPGTRVAYLRYAGSGTRGPEYCPATGKVVMSFPSHLVLNVGGRYGTPAMLDARNFIGTKEAA